MITFSTCLRCLVVATLAALDECANNNKELLDCTQESMPHYHRCINGARTHFACCKMHSDECARFKKCSGKTTVHGNVAKKKKLKQSVPAAVGKLGSVDMSRGCAITTAQYRLCLQGVRMPIECCWLYADECSLYHNECKPGYIGPHFHQNKTKEANRKATKGEGNGGKNGPKKVLAQVSTATEQSLGVASGNKPQGKFSHNALGFSHRTQASAAQTCAAPIHRYRACLNGTAKPMECCQKHPPIECCEEYPQDCKIYMECSEFHPVTLNSVLVYLTITALALTGSVYAHKHWTENKAYWTETCGSEWPSVDWDYIEEKLAQLGRISAVGSYRLVPTKNRQEWERDEGEGSVGYEGEAIGVKPEC
jgi:hypothetical protein